MAVLTSMIGHAVMVLKMTANPLVMILGSGLHYSDAAFVIQWRLVGMFAPSCITF